MPLAGGNRYPLLLTAASTTAAKIMDEQPNLRALVIQNLDASITLYFGTSAGVTSSSYLFSLAPGKTLSDKARAALWVVAGSGTPALGGFWED